MFPLDAIARDPDLNVEIANDQEAQAVLLKLGLIHYFPNESGFSEPIVHLLAHNGLKTHMLAAIRFSGHKLKKDNGYIVYLMPRSGFDPGANVLMIQNMKKHHESRGVFAAILDTNDDKQRN